MAAKKCLICNSPFRGRVDAKTCSPRCRKRLQQLRFSLAHGERSDDKSGGWRKAVTILIIGLFGALSLLVSGTPPKAHAITPATNLNFQGRLLNAAGAVVPDGNYNIDFRIYNTSSGTITGNGGAVGTCSNACLWEESHLVSGGASQYVTVTNGYFSVNLGSITAFPSTMNWDQQLYMTMNVTTNGTLSCSPASACTWNGEMQSGGSDIALTSVPLAFRANQLAVAGTNEQVLQFGSSTFGQTTTISLQDPGATTANICYETGTAVNHTCAAATGGAGYIQNQTASLQQANFRIQSAASGSIAAAINGASGQSVDIFDVNTNGNANPVFGINSTGNATLRAASASTTAFQLQNTVGNNILSVDNTSQTNLLTTITANGTGSFEAGGAGSTTGWAADNGASAPTAVGTGTTQPFNGLFSGQTAATATNHGMNYVTGASGLSASTQYTFSFYAKVSTTPGNVLNFGFAPSGTEDTANFTQTSQFVTTSGWTRYSITFKTGASLNAADKLYIKQNDATTRSLWVDGATLQLDNASADNTYREGKINVGGVISSSLILQNASNSTTAFQVQNASGAPVFTVDTTDTNLLPNPGAEVSTAGWSAKGSAGAAIIRDTSQQKFGYASFRINSGTTPTANDGAQYTGLSFPVASYSIGLSVKLSSGAFGAGTLVAGINNGAANADNSCVLSPAVSASVPTTTGWTRFTCTLGGASTVGTTFFIKQTDAVAHTYWVDGIELDSGTTLSPYGVGAISLNGIVRTPLNLQNQSNSTTALTLYDTSGNSLINADTLNDIIGLGSSGAQNLASTVNIANSSASGAIQTVNLGSNGNASSAVNIEAGNTGKIQIGNAASAHTIQIGAGSGANDVAITIGSGTTGGNAANVTIGSLTTSTTSAVILQGGNGTIAGSGASIKITPNTAGDLLVGNAAGTGIITIGSSTAAQTVNISNGTGAATVTIANTAASATGNTVSINGSNTATGLTDTVNIATGNTVGTGAKVVHIADGNPAGTNTVTIGSATNTNNVTTLQGGNGTIVGTGAAIRLQTATAGDIYIGAAAGTGIIALGQSSGGQTVNIANGTGAPTVNIANTSTAGVNISIAGAANTVANTISILNGASGANATFNLLSGVGTAGAADIHIGNNARVNVIDLGNVANAANRTTTIAAGNTPTGISDTVNIATGNTVGTGTKVVHIADGNPAGTNSVTIGSVTATGNTTTIQGGNGSQAILLQTATSGTIIIGNQSASTNNTITIGNSGASTNTDNVSINNTSGADTSTVIIGGSGNATGTLTFGQSTGSQTVNIGSGNGSSATQVVNIAGGSSATAGSKTVNIANGAPGTSTTNAVNIGTGGGAGAGTVGITIGSATAAAHTLVLQGGNGTGASAAIKIQPNAAGDVLIGGADTTGAITLGAAGQSGAINIGQTSSSSTNQTINIGVTTGVTSTETINIGTSSTATSISNVLIGSSITSGSTTQVQSAGGLIIGKASTVNGTVIFDNTGGSNTVSIQAQATNPASSLVIQLPTVGALVGNCLQSDTGSTTTNTLLKFGSCGGVTPTLQQAYNASTTSPQITLNSSPGAGGLVIKDNATPITGSLFSVQSAIGNSLLNVNSNSFQGMDSYTRSIALNSGWGSADIGGAWTTYQLTTSTNTDFGVNGTQGQMNISAANSDRTALLGSSSLTNFDISAEVQISSTPTGSGSGTFYSLMARSTTASSGRTGYRFKLSQSLANFGQATIYSVNTGVENQLSQGNIGSLTPSALYWLRARGVGTTLSFKVWQNGTTEPSAWTAQTVDSTYTTGVVGVQGLVATGGTNLPTVLWDNFSATDISGSDTTNNTLSANAGFNSYSDSTIAATSNTAFQIQNVTGQNILIADTNNFRISVGANGTATGQFYVGGKLPTTIVTGVTTDSGAHQVVVQGHYAYQLNYTAGTLQIIDITNPANPATIYKANPGGLAAPGTGIEAIYGHYLYIGNQNGGKQFEVIDVSNPSSPLLVNTISSDSDPHAIQIVGHYMYIATFASSSFEVYDVASPANPVKISDVNTTSNINSMTVQNGYAYLTGYSDGKLRIYNVSNPYDPQIVSTTLISGVSGLRGIAVSGRYAYMGDYLNGRLAIWDISNPSIPSHIGLTDVTTGPQALWVAVQGRYAYVDNLSAATLSVVDISDPATATKVGDITTGANPGNFAVAGRYIYVPNGYATSGSTLQIFDIGGAYVQQLQAGGTETGTLNVDDTATFGSDVNIQGGLTVAGGASFQNPISVGVSGDANSAFLVGDKKGSTIMNVSAVANGNLLKDGNFEGSSVNTSSVTPYNGSADTLSTSTAAPIFGAQNLLDTTTATANRGIKLNYGFKPNTNYTFSVYANVASGSPTANLALGNESTTYSTGTVTVTSGTGAVTGVGTGWSAGTNVSVGDQIVFPDGQVGVVTVVGGATSLTIVPTTISEAAGTEYTIERASDCSAVTPTTTKTRYSCSFTTGSSPDANGGVYVRYTSATTAFNFNFDGAQLEYGSAATPFGDPGIVMQNLIGNAGFESSTNGWSTKTITGSATAASISQSSNFALYGNSDLKFVTGTGNGDILNYSTSFKPNTQYTLSLWARLDTGTASIFNIGRSETTAIEGTATQTLTTVTGTGTTWFTDGVQSGSMIVWANGDTDKITNTPGSNGSTLTVTRSASESGAYTIYINNDSPCATNSTINTTWTQYTCTFTTGATQGPVSSIYLRDTAATNVNVYIDGVTLSPGNTPLPYTQPANGIDVDSLADNVTINSGAGGEIQPWTLSGTSLPAVNLLYGSAAYNGYIYIVGGSSNAGVYTNAYYASLNSDGTVGSFTATSSLPVGLQRADLVATNSYLYFIGGKNSGGTDVSTVYYARINADGSIGTWNTTTSLFSPLNTTTLSHTSAIAANGYIYVIGGHANGASSASTYYAKVNADGTIGGWTAGTNLSGVSEKQGLAVSNNFIYVIGGVNATTGIDGAATYYDSINPNTGAMGGSWTPTTALPAAVGPGSNTVMLNGKIYIIGGYYGNGSSAQVYYANINSSGGIGSWSVSTNPLPVTERGIAPVAANGYIYVMGGAQGSVATPMTSIYVAATNRTLIKGSLDLLGLNGGSLGGGGGIGGSLTAGNTQIVGSLQVQGAGTFSQGLSVNGLTSLETANVSGSVPAAKLGSLADGNGNDGLAVSGRYAYAVDTVNKLFKVIDISNPASPVDVSTNLSLTGSPEIVHVLGHYAYVVTRSTDALDVIDVSNPHTPTLVGTTSSSINNPFGLYAQGRYVYVTNQPAAAINTLSIYDVSNPSLPILAGNVQTDSGNTSASSGNLFVSGNYAYVVNNSDHSHGLEVFNISNAASPVSVGSVDCGSSPGSCVPRDVYVQGRYAYVTDRANAKLLIYDISNPATTYTLVGSVSVHTQAQSVYVQGHNAYVTNFGDATNGLEIINVSNPASPASVGTVATDTSPFGLVVSGRYAYVQAKSATANLDTFDLGGEYAQQFEAGGAEVGTLSVDSNSLFAGDVGIQGGTTIGQSLQVGDDLGVQGKAYIQGTGSINVSYSLMSTPTGVAAANAVKAAITSVTPASGAATSYTYEVVAVTQAGNSSASSTVTNAAGAVTLDSTHNETVAITAYGGTTYMYYVYRTASTATAGSSSASLGLIGTTNTTSFVDTGQWAGGTIPTPGGSLTTANVYKYKVTAFDAIGNETAASSEVSVTATSPALTNDISWTSVTGAYGYKVYRTAGNGASGSEVYLATVLGQNNSYTGTFSFTDTGSITAGTATPPTTSTAKVSSDNGNGSLQLEIGGQGTPTGQLYVSGMQPQFVGQNNDPTLNNVNGTNSVVVVGRYAYISNTAANKVDIFDVSNPSGPVLIGQNSDATLSSPFGIAVQGKYAYLGSFSNSLLAVYDISNPANPTLVNSVAATSPTSVVVQGHYAFVLSSSKLTIFDVSNPASPVQVGQNSDSNISSGTGLFIQGRYAYVTTGTNNKLDIYDVGNPFSPTFTGQNADSTLTNPEGVYVQGRYAYVGAANTTAVYDINNPSSPVLVGNNTGIAGGWGLSLQGRYLYETLPTGAKVSVVDVSNPAYPVLAAQNSDSNLTSPEGLFVAGRYAYIVNHSGANSKLDVYDLGGTYTQQLEAGGAEFGTLTADSNAQFGGDVNIQGGENIGQSLQVGGSVGVGGNASINGNGSFGANTGNELFSDNFESGNFKLWARDSGGSPTISNTSAHSGTYSANFTATAASAYQHGLFSPVSTAYMRVWVKVNSVTTTAVVAEMGGFQGYDGNTTATDGVGVKYSSGQACLYHLVGGATIGSCGGNFTTGDWHMITMRFTPNGAGNATSQMWFDGTQIVNNSATVINVNNVDASDIGDDTAANTFNMNIDDVAIDTTDPGTESSLNIQDTLNVSGSSSLGNVIINSPGTDNTPLVINDTTTGINLLTVRDLNTNFGSAVTGGAFIGRNSYWGEDFNNGHATNCGGTFVTVAGTTINGYARGDYGNPGTTTACNVNATNVPNVGGGELNASFTSGATVGGSCTTSSQNVANGVERIASVGSATASTSQNCVLNLAATATTSNRTVVPGNLPVVTMKLKPQTLTGSSNNDRVQIGLIPQDTSGGLGNNSPANSIYFTNCSTWVNAGTPTGCSNTTWYGITSGATTATVLTCSTGSGSLTANFSYLRIEVRSTTDVHFYADYNTANGIQESECGNGAWSNVTASALTPWMQVMHLTNNTNGINLDMDYFRFWQDDNIDTSSSSTASDAGSTTDTSVLSEAPITPDPNQADPNVPGSFFNFLGATSEDTVINGNLFVHGTIYADKIKANEIEGLSIYTDQLDSLQAELSAVKAASTSNVSGSGSSSSGSAESSEGNGGALTLNIGASGLTVGGDANFEGNVFFYKLVTFVEKSVFNNDVSFNAHITTGGGAPTDKLEAAAGSTDNTSANVATASVSGNDNSGQVGITTGDNGTTGKLVTINFAKSFDKAPQVVLTATNDQTAAIRYYVQSTANGFAIFVIDAPTSGTHLNFNYFVIQ